MSVRQRISKLEAQAGAENDTSRDHSVLELLVAEDVDDADLQGQSDRMRKALDRMARLICRDEHTTRGGQP
jgi:hypothetical protein